MSKNKGIKPEEKIQYVEEYLDGKISQSEIAKELGLKKESIRAWIAKYQSEGSVALLKHKQNRSYTPELKRQAVLDYLAGNGSMLEISKKYKIRSKSILERWIKVYNSGKDFKHKMSGGRRMKNTRKTTQEERDEIVSVLDRFLEVHDYIEETRDKKISKAINKKMLSETHMISLVPFIKKSIDDGISKELVADFIADSFGGDVIVSDDYQNACLSSSAKNVSIRRRNDALNAAWEKFFDDDSNNNADDFSGAMNAPESEDE